MNNCEKAQYLLHLTNNKDDDVEFDSISDIAVIQ